MANSRIIVPSDGSWVDLGSAVIQFSNIGSAPLYVQYASVEPAAGAYGDMYDFGEGDRPLTPQQAYARVQVAGVGPGYVFVHE